MFRYEYLHDFFEQSVELYPEQPAVDDHGVKSTYKELDERANQIAGFLISAGCVPNARVGVCTGKNAHAYAGLLAALKAGGCFVPLGEDWPEDRLDRLIKSIEPCAIIVEPHTLELILKTRERLSASFQIVLLGGDNNKENVCGETQIKTYSKTKIENALRSPDDLAYIIFTSGSTGVPKGVMVLHRNIVQFLSLCDGYFKVAPLSRFAHHSELTFDPSLLDMFYCWSIGGALVPFNKRRYRIDPASFIKETGVNVWFSVPSVLSIIHRAKQIGSTDLSTIKHLILTGEAASAEIVKLWSSAYPECRIYNVYGTTETAIISHWYTVGTELSKDMPIPVGKPLPGVRIYLLDSNGNQVPRGQPGECIVYSSQLSPGYWDSEAESSARFVNYPFDSRLPQRVYRSGDLLRELEDGNYEYVGRADRQVKVRGHRVELREVESAILPFPGIQEAAVVAAKDPHNPDLSHLVAYVAVSKEIDENELTAFLKKQIPLFMVPSSIKKVSKSLPRNQNQKIDYAELQKLPESNYRDTENLK